MINLFDFTGKNILITGAGTGIGKETAIQLHKAGAKLIILDKDEKAMQEVAANLGSYVVYYAADLSATASLAPLLKTVIAKSGPLDGFVHCVGVRSRRPINLIKPEEVHQIMNINFVAFIEMVRLITRKGNFNPGLSIVGISSIASIRGGAGVTLYAASKAAMDAAVRCLAKELAPKNIRLNTVMPAQINTPAYDNLRTMSGDAEDATLNRQYLGLGEPIDVANAIVFLLGTGSGFISGSAIPVDGGFLTT